MVTSANNIELTSLDFAQLIQIAAQRFHKTILNKTQINKILFYVYGVYLAENNNQRLFIDDSPKAWPFGPVFPKVYKHFVTDGIVKGFSKEKADAIRSKGNVLEIVVTAVKYMHNKSAYDLTRWSHQEGSPWYNTIYELDEEGNVKTQKPWNTRIEDSLISKYFSNPQNRIPEN